MNAEFDQKSVADAGTGSANPLAGDPELLGDFIMESREHLTAIELQLLTLDQDPGNSEAIHAIFRGFHTIKGMAGFLDLDAVRDLAHEVETVLDLARNARLAITSEIIDRILESKDYLNVWMTELETMLQTGKTPAPPEAAGLMEAIHALVTGGSGISDARVHPTDPAANETRTEEPAQATTAGPVQAKTAGPVQAKTEGLTQTKTEGLIRAETEGLTQAKPESPVQTRTEGRVQAGPPPTLATPGLIELAREVAAVPPAETASEPPQAESSETAKASEARSSGARSIKVETAKLDYLVDMVGELVISQSLVRHDPDLAMAQKPRLARNLSQLARITDDIQRTAMSMRMIPIGQLFQKTSRLVRDLSRKAAKQVELELLGEETELDRNIVEELADPLMHMVRNSVDHGIETPEERLAAGKSALAHVTLKAGHQAGHIVIQVSDDGRGLPREKILRKAREKNLIEAGAELSESEIFALIFHPGFSTADKITDVSGRGVGMDVVRKQVQKLRGRIDVLSKPGEGTTFLLKLPLTLAIIDGLVVGVGDQRYIVPLFAVREMLQPAEEAISTIHGRQEMAMVRGTLLPVIRLHQRFSVQPRRLNPWESLLIVAESGSKLFCLMVDELIGKQEVVIKSLGEGMRNIAGVAGGAILGDGRVGLILDPEGLFGSSNGRNHGE